MATFGRQRIADARFVERTGKSMREWTKILDRWGARGKGHTATARYLEKEAAVDGWWAQAVTIQYEYQKGLRKPLTVPAGLRRALAASPKAKAAWSPGPLICQCNTLGYLDYTVLHLLSCLHYGSGYEYAN